MSSFLVEHKTINTIVSYLSLGRNLDWIRREIKKVLSFDLETYEGKQQMGKFMFKMNISATHERYKGGVEDFGPLLYRYACQPHFTCYSALKSLSSWLYQCAEGKTFESDEYKFFDKLRGDIAYHIVRQTPAYDKASGWN